MSREFAVMFTDSGRERYAEVAVDVDFANSHLSSFSQFGFGDTDCIGHVATELVNDGNLVLRNGGCTVKNDGEAGQSLADFFQDVQTEFRVLTGLEFVCAVRSTDCDCKRVDARSCREFFNFVGGTTSLLPKGKNFTERAVWEIKSSFTFSFWCDIIN